MEQLSVVQNQPLGDQNPFLADIDSFKEPISIFFQNKIQFNKFFTLPKSTGKKTKFPIFLYKNESLTSTLTWKDGINLMLCCHLTSSSNCEKVLIQKSKKSITIILQLMRTPKDLPNVPKEQRDYTNLMTDNYPKDSRRMIVTFQKNSDQVYAYLTGVPYISQIPLKNEHFRLSTLQFHSKFPQFYYFQIYYALEKYEDSTFRHVHYHCATEIEDVLSFLFKYNQSDKKFFYLPNLKLLDKFGYLSIIRDLQYKSLDQKPIPFLSTILKENGGFLYYQDQKCMDKKCQYQISMKNFSEKKKNTTD